MLTFQWAWASPFPMGKASLLLLLVFHVAAAAAAAPEIAPLKPILPEDEVAYIVEGPQVVNNTPFISSFSKKFRRQLKELQPKDAPQSLAVTAPKTEPPAASFEPEAAAEDFGARAPSDAAHLAEANASLENRGRSTSKWKIRAKKFTKNAHKVVLFILTVIIFLCILEALFSMIEWRLSHIFLELEDEEASPGLPKESFNQREYMEKRGLQAEKIRALQQGFSLDEYRKAKNMSEKE